MKKLFIGALVILCLAIATPAVAGSWADSRLDAAASQVAGHPVQVWCEMSWADWIHDGDSVGQDYGVVGGWTTFARPVIHISPAHCDTLHAMLDQELVGTYHASIAILTLAHESVHQRGVADEGVADCTALPLVPAIANATFGIPTTMAETYMQTVRKKVTVRINGKAYVRYVTTKRVATRQVQHPYMTYLKEDALRWHRAAPSAYQGGC